MEQNKREQFIIRRIGGTTYKVRVVFNESGGETMEDKILRIVRNDMVTSGGTCTKRAALQCGSHQQCPCRR
ncbi:MAG: transposon-encoded TnpW family protein [Oscillospiraceae bacterium]